MERLAAASMLDFPIRTGLVNLSPSTKTSSPDGTSSTVSRGSGPADSKWQSMMVILPESTEYPVHKRARIQASTSSQRPITEFANLTKTLGPPWDPDFR